MAVHYRADGFILKKIDRGEADQLFTIYTKNFGKLEIIGKAIRKIKSKLRGGSELFYLSNVEFIQGKNYKTLTDAILTDRFSNIRNNLDKLIIANQIADALNNLVGGQESDKKIWQLLSDVFKKLDSCQIAKLPNYQLIYYYFLWNLLSILGYQINLHNCALCQKKLLPGKNYFNSQEGGIVCSGCFKKLKKGKEISPEVIKILRIFLKKDWETLLKLKIEKSYLDLLGIISNDYFFYHRFNK